MLKVFILSLNLCIIIYVQNFFGDKRPLNGVQIVDILPSKSWQTAYNEHLLLGITTLKLPNVTLICQIRAQDKFPCVFKIGHAHGGLGKVSDNNIWILSCLSRDRSYENRQVRVDSQGSFQDLASVVAVSTHYCTVEEFIEAKYDLHIFKIDKHYKALM